MDDDIADEDLPRVVTFHEQRLGIYIVEARDHSTRVHGLLESNAEDNHLRDVNNGDKIIAVNGKSVLYQSYETIKRWLQTFPRPITVTFLRPGAEVYRDAFDFVRSKAYAQMEKAALRKQHSVNQASELAWMSFFKQMASDSLFSTEPDSLPTVENGGADSRAGLGQGVMGGFGLLCFHRDVWGRCMWDADPADTHARPVVLPPGAEDMAVVEEPKSGDTPHRQRLELLDAAKYFIRRVRLHSHHYSCMRSFKLPRPRSRASSGSTRASSPVSSDPPTPPRHEPFGSLSAAGYATLRETRQFPACAIGEQSSEVAAMFRAQRQTAAASLAVMAWLANGSMAPTLQFSPQSQAPTSPPAAGVSPVAPSPVTPDESADGLAALPSAARAARVVYEPLVQAKSDSDGIATAAAVPESSAVSPTFYPSYCPCRTQRAILIRRKVSYLIHAGAPPVLRALIWFELSGARARAECFPAGFFHHLSRIEASPEIEDSIMKDVDRTFPGHRLFEQPSGQLALRRVLRAISHRIPEVGYCQSMNFVVAALLVVLEEEQAFWVADVLFQEYFTPDYFTEAIVDAHADQVAVQRLIQLKLPDVWEKVHDAGADFSIITLSWFMTAFSSDLPFHTVLRIWDLMFLYGTEVLVRMAVAIVGLNRDRIMATPTGQGPMFMALTRMVQHPDLHFPDKLFAIAGIPADESWPTAAALTAEANAAAVAERVALARALRPAQRTVLARDGENEAIPAVRRVRSAHYRTTASGHVVITPDMHDDEDVDMEPHPASPTPDSDTRALAQRTLKAARCSEQRVTSSSKKLSSLRWSDSLCSRTSRWGVLHALATVLMPSHEHAHEHSGEPDTPRADLLAREFDARERQTALIGSVMDAQERMQLAMDEDSVEAMRVHARRETRHRYVVQS